MAREFFKNLPDTTTPVEASRMNDLLDGDEAMGNIVVDSIRSKNMFDEIQLLTASGWSKNSSGYYYGTFGEFYNKFGDGFTINGNFKENTQYTFSANAYVSASSVVFRFQYTDGTRSDFTVNQTSATNLTFTTSPNKTLLKVVGIYSSGASNILYIKNIQLEEGTTATNYAPYQNLDGYEIYSATEQIIGKWIDNSTLYRKVIDLGSFPNNSSKSVAHNCSNIQRIISLTGIGFIDDSDITTVALPLVDKDGLQYSIQLRADKTNVTVITGSNRTALQGYAIMEYIKIN